jgi:hypothetical protein
MGRPRKYNDEQIQEIINSFNEYIDNIDIPIVAEFCYQNSILRKTLYEYPEFSDTIKRAIDKKEAQLERKALYNEVDHTMAIFSLKQLGWKDKQEVQHEGNIVVNVVPASEYVKDTADK